MLIYDYPVFGGKVDLAFYLRVRCNIMEKSLHSVGYPLGESNVDDVLVVLLEWKDVEIRSHRRLDCLVELKWLC